MKNSTHPRLIHQANNCSRVIYNLSRDIYLSRKPADRILRSFFRQNKKCGASDRRFISESIYSLFRWWGWLRHLTKSEERLWHGDFKNVNTATDWLSILLAAHILESIELHPIAAYWKELLSKRLKLSGFIQGMKGKPLQDCADYLNALFKISLKGWKELVPDWFIKELELAEAEGETVMEFMQKRPPLWLRAQTKNISGLKENLRISGLNAEQSGMIENALALHSPRINLYELPLFRTGKFEIQDFASQIIGIACNASPGERWWDVCAGAGGKSLQLAWLMENKGLVVATDIRSWKSVDLRRRARRSKFFNITARDWNGKGIPVRTPNFDGVLVDAPCSGTGTWRRNPEGRWNTSQKELPTFFDLQYQILTNAAKAVKPGGVLIYATCSICVIENEDVVNKFLGHHSNFSLTPLTHPLTGNRVNGMIRVWPQTADSDAIFVARMRNTVKD